VNGVAVTGGFELALNCDLLVASDRARFADTHARVGVQPGWGLTVLLPQAIGVPPRPGDERDGQLPRRPHRAGVGGSSNHVVPHDELLPYCRQLAADIVSNDQPGVRAILRTYAEGSEATGGRRVDDRGPQRRAVGCATAAGGPRRWSGAASRSLPAAAPRLPK